jgi:hypothetical protein
MRRDPARDVNADRGDLAAPRVNAGQALDWKSIDTEVRHGPDQHFFEIANVAMNVLAIGTQIDDRITDNLAQSVISHFSAAIRLKQRHIPRSKLLFVEQDRGAIAAPANRQCVWVFQQEQRVGLDAGFDRKLGLFLDCEGGFVIQAAQSLDQKLSFLRHTAMQPDRGLLASF